MYKAIEDLLDKAQSAQSDDQFNSDLDEAQSYLDDKVRCRQRQAGFSGK